MSDEEFTDLEDDQSRADVLLSEALQTARTLLPLKSLRPEFLTDLFAHAAVQTVFAGQTVFEEGTLDGQHIYIQHGDVDLHFPNGTTQRLNGRDSTEPMAHQQPRPCQAVAVTDCNLIRIDSDRLDRTLSWSEISKYLLSELAAQPDQVEDIDWMRTVLQSNLFFKVPPVNVEKIYSKMQPILVMDGDTILRQGEIGDCCYFIKEGSAEVTVRKPWTKGRSKVAEISVGRCFGEDALLNETVRNATISMTSDGVLMRLEKKDFQLLLEAPAVDEIGYDDIATMNEPPILVDVRTEDEYSQGHLPRAANLPISLLSLKKRVLSTGRQYLLYCESGRRSSAAAYLLGKQGYDTLSLKEGLMGADLFSELTDQGCYILRDGNLVEGQ